MTIHREIEAQLSPYMDGELRPEESQTIEGHLAQCADCSRRLEELRSTARALRGLPQAEVPEDVARRLSAAVSEELAAARPSRSSARPWLRTSPAFAAAALVVGIAVIFALRALPGAEQVTAPPSAVGTKAPEVMRDAPAAGRGSETSPPPADLPEQRLFPPEVIISRADYRGKLEDALDRLAKEPAVQEALRRGSTGGEARRKAVIEEMVALAEKKGADAASLRRAFAVSTPGAANIPLRAELIRHEGRDVWLLAYVGASSSDGIRTAAIDAESGEPLAAGGMVP